MNLTFPRTRYFLWYWLPPLFWSGAVICFSGDLGASQNSLGLLKWLLSWLPPLSPGQWELIHYYSRKTVGHFGNYGFLYFLWFRAFQENLAYRPGRAFLWSLVLCLGLALLDEGHQSLLASRGGSLRDVALDLSGVSAAALITWLFWTPRLRSPAEN